MGFGSEGKCVMRYRIISYEREHGVFLCEPVGEKYPRAIRLDLDYDNVEVLDEYRESYVGRVVEVESLVPYLSIAMGARILPEGSE